MLNNKNILLTGGTGSFGHLFVEKVVKKYKPKRLVIFSRDEVKQSLMAQKYPQKKYPFIRFFIGDVRDLDRIRLAMEGIDYVVHAAALKQINIAEYNPMECIKTNVGGAENVAKAALYANVSMVIALSTDKASDPVSLYGASKLTADKLFISANNIRGGVRATKMSVVRYGNVAGSRGSIVPIFEELIKKGATKLPITDTRMTRFWITLDEATEFIFKAFDRMKGGEIFIPKIPSIRIVDLAKAMLPKGKINIIGLRPGEKLSEKLFSGNESHLTIEFKDHYVIRPSVIFQEKKIDYYKNGKKEIGKNVKDGFEYRSDNNKDFLTIDQIKKINQKIKKHL